MKATATILQGDVREKLKELPAGVFHCSVSSPPYWALRSYLPSDHPLKSYELGSEPTPELFIENLVGVYREVKRVLRDDGSCWVNLGDSYNAGTSAPSKAGRGDVAGWRDSESIGRARSDVPTLKPLDRVGIPERFALAMQADGWYWRDTVIWAKPSPMPLSIDGWRWERCKRKTAGGIDKRDVHSGQKPHGDDIRDRDGRTEWTDCLGCKKCKTNGGYVLRKGSWRTTTAHEYLYLFTKSDSYYGDREAVATPALMTTVERNRYTRVVDDPDEQFAVKHDHEFDGATANLRSVWIIGAEATKEKHYAAYPSALAERCILASTSGHGVCQNCGAPWARMVDREFEQTQNGVRSDAKGLDESDNRGDFPRGRTNSTTLGWRPTCGCEAKAIPASVLDPFGGTGRTIVAAIRNGRSGVMTELNPESVEIARRQIDGVAPLFHIAEVA